MSDDINKAVNMTEKLADLLNETFVDYIENARNTEYEIISSYYLQIIMSALLSFMGRQIATLKIINNFSDCSVTKSLEKKIAEWESFLRKEI